MTTFDLRANKYKFFAVGAIGTFMGTLNGSILNVALPTITRYFGVTVDLVAWVVLAYSLTLVSLMMVFGAWANRKGYAFAYKFGYIFFLAGSVVCSMGWSIYVLIFGRVLQGIGASMLQAIGPGMVTRVFPANERGKGIGMMTMMVASGLMTGPVIGGLLLDLWSWQLIFIINILVGIFGLLFTFKYFKALKTPESEGKMKLAGVISLSVSLLSFMFGIYQVKEFGLSDIRVISAGVVAILTFMIFIKLETNPQKALINLAIFKNRVFSSSVAAMLTLYASMAGVLILIPFYLEQVKHLPPREVGLYLIILPVLMFICAPLSGRLSDKIGYRLLTITGILVHLVGLYFLSRLTEVSTSLYIVLCLVAVGFGNGIFSSPNSSALMGSVDESKRSIASGILGTTRNIGMALGISLATVLFSYYQSQANGQETNSLVFIYSFQKVIMFAIIVAGLGLPFCLIRGNRVGR